MRVRDVLDDIEAQGRVVAGGRDLVERLKLAGPSARVPPALRVRRKRVNTVELRGQLVGGNVVADAWAIRTAADVDRSPAEAIVGAHNIEQKWRWGASRS